MSDLKDIFSEWQSNLEFRENFKKNPEDALKKAGFDLSEEDLSKVKALLTLNKSDNEKLDERISK